MRRAILLETVTFAMLLVAIGLAVVAINSNRGLARQGKQAHDGLCALKYDLRQRIKDGHAFLKAHPNGIPGIKVGVIRAAVKNQESTLEALSVLPCPADPPAKGHQ